jgi:hypothetical protein
MTVCINISRMKHLGYSPKNVLDTHRRGIPARGRSTAWMLSPSLHGCIYGVPKAGDTANRWVTLEVSHD